MTELLNNTKLFYGFVFGLDSPLNILGKIVLTPFVFLIWLAWSFLDLVCVCMELISDFLDKLFLRGKNK